MLDMFLFFNTKLTNYNTPFMSPMQSLAVSVRCAGPPLSRLEKPPDWWLVAFAVPSGSFNISSVRPIDRRASYDTHIHI